MINLVHHRKVDVDPPLESINDTWNGILLNVAFSGLFRASDTAFLWVSLFNPIAFSFHVV